MTVYHSNRIWLAIRLNYKTGFKFSTFLHKYGLYSFLRSIRVRIWNTRIRFHHHIYNVGYYTSTIGKLYKSTRKVRWVLNKLNRKGSEYYIKSVTEISKKRRSTWLIKTGEFTGTNWTFSVGQITLKASVKWQN